MVDKSGTLIHIKRHSELITATILIFIFGFGMYELYTHTEYFSECVKSHESDGQTEMTRHNICDQYAQVKNSNYHQGFP